MSIAIIELAPSMHMKANLGMQTRPRDLGSV